MEVTWSRFEAEASNLAELVRARFESDVHHVLGTVRADGSPRLSGTEAHVLDGELTLGMMDESRKQDDIERDPRVELHSHPDGPDLASGDARVAGRLEATGPAPMPEDAHGDMSTGTMYRLLISRVVLVRVLGDQIEVRSWSPRDGESVVKRR